jgi:UDP-N-acetylmuramoyl-L-alanyl-D-glutamate--2,6-diaminopimelate ligase
MPIGTSDTTFVLVRDAREAMAVATDVIYDYPSRALDIYGITGTNGKTTTAHVLRSLLLSREQPVGMIGTLGMTIENSVPTGYTTPEAPDLARIFTQMGAHSVKSVVMEVSSHALKLKRVDGIEFRGAIFTNITQDHLDFHSSFEDYVEAKRSLFSRLDVQATALVNIDDVQGAGMARDCHAAVIRYGVGEGADLRISNTHIAPDHSSWVVDWPEAFGGERQRLRSHLPGMFNIYNVTAACGMAVAAGLNVEDMPRLVSEIQPVPGRMETIPLQNGATAIVDYAHTPDALKQLLRSVNETKVSGRTILVFGCGGDRDATKRPLMGGIAAELADVVIVTSDNPRTEKPESIVDDIRAGMTRSKADVDTVVDRREAISRALDICQSEDVVVVAGKGHETVQIVDREQRHFDDREVIREWMAAATQ